MRTAPKSNPVMACDYDDETGTAPASSGIASGSGASSLNQVEADGEDVGMENGGKKKRKANSGKKKDDGADDSRATLMKRIRKYERGEGGR